MVDLWIGSDNDDDQVKITNKLAPPGTPFYLPRPGRIAPANIAPANN